jgi:hypothetical protein
MYLYPAEIIADTYVSMLGGFSQEIDSKEVGININALFSNTSIIAGETEARLKFIDERNLPYFLRKPLTVVGIPHHSDAFELSQNGEIVLSEDYTDKMRKLVGKEVIINTVESFRIDGDYSLILKRLKMHYNDNSF